ncbi:MAG: hypothetical protein IJP07_05825 [Firmicutes bacterium]|nr:hypothetical protein [Bacillota bacterium]
MKVVAYEERFGEISFPEGFEELLKNLPIEEQMEHYRTTEYSSYSMTNWCERTQKGSAIRIQNDRDVTALIVKDGILVGVMMLNDSNREVPCLAEERVCTYYASDNNGAGYKERIDYTYLICVPKNFDEEKQS